MGWGDPPQPLTIRYNNPGAIEYQPWMDQYGGSRGANGRYAQFSSPDQGYQVMGKILDTYEQKHGLNTIEGIIGRWAPASVDNNSTAQYIASVAKRLGIPANAPIKSDWRPQLMQAIAAYEAGRDVAGPTGAPPPYEKRGMRRLDYNDNTPPTLLPQAQGAKPPMTQPQGQGGLLGFLQGLGQSVQSPLFQSGAAMFNAGAEGKNIGAGFMASGEASATAAKRLRELQKQQQEDAQQQQWKQMFASGQRPPWASNLPQGTWELAQALGPLAGPQLITGMMTRNADRDFDERRLALAERTHEAQQQQIKMQTPEWRMANAARFGIDPNTDEGRAFVINGQYAPAAGQTDDIREFAYAQKNGFTGTFTDWMKQKRDMGNNAAQQVTWGRDANGNWVAMQATRGGELVQSKLPPNVTPVPVPEMAGLKAAATEQGQAAGKAKVDLPGVESRAKMMKDALDGVEQAVTANPRMTNPVTGVLPNVTGSARDTQAKIDQVQGKVFLQAFDALRGAGAITENEGAQAKAALSRLQATAVGSKAYFDAIADVRKEIEELVKLARVKAGGGTAAAPSTTTPPPGVYVFDPATGTLRPK